MGPFILKIPARKRTTPHRSPYSALWLIDSELRRKPGITDEEWQNDIIGWTQDDTSGVRRLTIGQNHGIREKNVSARMREAFKEDMPKIIEMFPGMANPFMGHIELHSDRWHLKEVHFFPKQ